jgi:PPOX class probable F420-dependent enzyme
VDPATARTRLGKARVGELATVRATDPEGRSAPHVVPVCFALDGDTVVTAVDAKPKTTAALRRLDNVRAHPDASLLVHAYDDEDWTRLWWVRVDGPAEVLTGGPERDAAIAHLVAKYAQYRAEPPPGAVIRLTIARWASWEWTSTT